MKREALAIAFRSSNRRRSLMNTKPLPCARNCSEPTRPWRQREVADLPRGRYPITYTKDFISIFVTHTQDAREMVNLLTYDLLLRAQGWDLDGGPSHLAAACSTVAGPSAMSPRERARR
jgi:hypothetical protein